MNSMIFTSFDAVCAELLGQKGRSDTAASSIDVNKKQQGDSQSHGPPLATYVKEEKQPQQRRSLRFAPELDGLNCFETLISY
ncbi:hypothetical protein I3760_11G107600 [Carya illinoinensis]|nr:hypothetical protein I3760_11G107600 [Carya illinoinensis]